MEAWDGYNLKAVIDLGICVLKMIFFFFFAVVGCWIDSNYEGFSFRTNNQVEWFIEKESVKTNLLYQTRMKNWIVMY